MSHYDVSADDVIIGDGKIKKKMKENHVADQMM
jgi:hypothetical protein